MNYSDITFNSLTYGAVSANGGTSSPSISYTQTYGWNGNLTDAGTITGGSNDDAYTTYKITTSQTGLSINADSGIIT